MACATEATIETRGWSMKKGHRTRLVGMQSASSFHDSEKSAGRSTVKRSIHSGSRRGFLDPCFVGKYGSNFKIQRRRVLIRQLMVADLREYDNTDVDNEEWQDDGWGEEVEWTGAEDDLISEMSFCSFETESTTASTRDSLLISRQRPTKALKRWEQAVWRADAAAKMYTKQAKSNGVLEPKKKQGPHKVNVLQEGLRSKFNMKLVGEHVADGQSDALQTFQLDFLEKNMAAICSGLRTVFRNEVLLRAVNISKHVQDRFFQSQSQLQGSLLAVFHGTDEANLPSIYQKGLLVPGGGTSVRIQHGASHGNGIYTAKTHNAALSFGFCRGAKRPILVCGVLDDATPLAKPQLLGNHYVTAESQRVRHVGDAIVVFDEGRVIPLFEAWEPGIGALCATSPRAGAISVPVAPPARPIPLQPKKAYNGGPRSRPSTKPASRQEKLVAFLQRHAARVRYAG